MGFVVKPSNELPHQFIARPDASKDSVVYKWPDRNIKYLSVVTVQPDEWAFFIKSGKVVGYLKPGEQRLDGASIPFLRDLLDRYTSNNVLLSELYFVSSREFANNKYGGSMGELCDPGTDVMVRCGVYGQYTLRVTDPEALILNLLGTRSPASNVEITGTIRERLLKVVRSVVNRTILDSGWDLLRVTSGAYTTEFEELVLDRMPLELSRYGLEVSCLEDLVVTVLPRDKPKLQEIYDRRAKMRLAENGSYATMAESEAILGAAKGLAATAAGGAGGVGETAGLGLGVGIGMGLGQRMAEGVGNASGLPVSGCVVCGNDLEPGDKFCPECAAPVVLVSRPVTECPSCGATVIARKYCSECGTALQKPSEQSG